MWSVYAGTRPAEAPKVVELVAREIKRLCAVGVRREELARAKNQMKGSVMLGLESTSSRMSKLAKDELHYGRRVSLDEVMANIDRVNESQLLRLSRELFDKRRLSVTALGPVSRRSLSSALN
jgi:predicted Zn-dependent peptidase